MPWPSSNRRRVTGRRYLDMREPKSSGKKNERLRWRCSWSGRGKEEAWRKLQKIQDLTPETPEGGKWLLLGWIFGHRSGFFR